MGFRWSPRFMVWTRKLTPNALRDVNNTLVPALLLLDDYAPSEDPAISLDRFAALHG